MNRAKQVRENEVRFDRSQFHYSGGHLTYGDDWQFVARFKYSTRDKAKFISFLMKNFTVNEYFRRMKSGECPVEILESKGYVSTTVALILKREGFPVTQEGFHAYITQKI